jgi:hypothetical protein
MIYTLTNPYREEFDYTFYNSKIVKRVVYIQKIKVDSKIKFIKHKKIV